MRKNENGSRELFLECTQERRRDTSYTLTFHPIFSKKEESLD
jgi:hypothetical protein